MSHTFPGPYKDLSANSPSTPPLYKISVALMIVLLFGLMLYRGLPASLINSHPPVKLIIYGFSTQEEVFSQHILPAFEAMWETRNNRDLIIETVFGPSGTMANQIVLGAPADVAIFSNAQHARWLQVARLLEAEPQVVVFGSTPIIIVTRPGNPAAIGEFADLAQPGLKLVHAEPGRSGAGDWSVLAEFGSAYLVSGDQDAAEAQVTQIWNNVQFLGSSARATLSLFELGAGDAVVTYEQDALLALDRGVPLEIVVPRRTIMAQHIVVVVDANVTSPEKKAAKDLVRFLMSDEGQTAMARHHLRPAGFDADSPAAIASPFTVEDLGGWSSCYHRLIERLWKAQIASQQTSESLPMLWEGQD